MLHGQPIANQFVGINPHLHSELQQPHGEWHEFHLVHIGDLVKVLRAKLVGLGYNVFAEKSLQIRRLDSDLKPNKPQYPTSDLTITDPWQQRAAIGRSPLPQMAQATFSAVMPTQAFLTTLLEEEKVYHAIGIYQQVEDWRGKHGDPVAWIELLSPSNKPGQLDFAIYYSKRYALLQNGVVFVELDYLHESPPTHSGVQIYNSLNPRNAPDPQAHPYRISLSVPRPTFNESWSYVAEFDVEQPIPTIPIPLSGDDVVEIDFNAAYQRTFNEGLYGQFVDYTALPVHFDRYNPRDQAAILRRLLTLLEAQQQGHTLGEHPLPLRYTDWDLAACLAYYEQL